MISYGTSTSTRFFKVKKGKLSASDWLHIPLQRTEYVLKRGSGFNRVGFEKIIFFAVFSWVFLGSVELVWVDFLAPVLTRVLFPGFLWVETGFAGFWRVNPGTTRVCDRTGVPLSLITLNRVLKPITDVKGVKRMLITEVEVVYLMVLLVYASRWYGVVLAFPYKGRHRAKVLTNFFFFFER